MRGQRLEVCAAVTCAAIKSIYAPPIRYIYRPKVAQEASQVEKPLLISILAPTRLDLTVAVAVAVAAGTTSGQRISRMGSLFS